MIKITKLKKISLSIIYYFKNFTMLLLINKRTFFIRLNRKYLIVSKLAFKISHKYSI